MALWGLRAFMVTPIGKRGLEPRRILVSNLAYPKTALEFRRNGIFIESVEKKNLALCGRYVYSFRGVWSDRIECHA